MNLFKRQSRNRFQGIDEQDDESSGGEDLFVNDHKYPQSRQIMTYNPVINRSQQDSNNYEQDAKYGSVAPTARIKNPQLFGKIKAGVQAIRRRRLTLSEISSLRQFIDGLAAHKIKHFSDDEIIKHAIGEFIKATSEMNSEDGEIDMHAVLGKEIGLNGENDVVSASLNRVPTTAVIANAVDLSSVLGNNDKYGIQSIVNPQALLNKTQVLLDSRNRSLDTDGTQLIKWSFSNTISVQQGSFNSTSPIRDIVAIKVFPFKIPYTATAENPTNNITMYFNEFSNQCVVAPESARYHHWFSYTQEGDWLALDAFHHNDGTYNFDKPITTLDTLSVSFGAPLTPIQFDLDRMSATMTSGNPTIFTFSTAHNLSTGNTIYFTNFSTSNTSSDAILISQINSLYGLEIIRINSTQVSVAIDSSGIVGTPTVSTAFFGEKRIFIPLELTYIKPKA